MKIPALFYCMMLFSCVWAQERYPYVRTDFKSLVLGDYNYIYNDQNSAVFYKKVTSLIELNNPDSSYKASKIMWGLLLFDTLKYSVENFKPLLDKIINSNTRYFENKLKGAWRFSHDSWSGMGFEPTTTTAVDTGKVIRLDGYRAWFFFNDSLFRQTTYKIQVRQTSNELTMVNNYNIHFDDKNEDWSFKFSTDPTPTLTIILNPLCSCGCGVDIYKKIADEPGITRRDDRKIN